MHGRVPVTELAIRTFYEYADSFDTDARNQSIKGVLNKRDAENHAAYFRLMERLLSEALGEIARAPFRSEDKRAAMVAGLNEAHDKMISAIVSRGGTEGKGPILAPQFLTRLEGYADQLEEKEIARLEPIDRESAVVETEEFIAQIKEWNLPEPANTTLIYQMNSFVQIVQAADTYSDEMLRKRVKEIVANCAVEMETFDKNYRTRMEAVRAWARKVAFPVGCGLIGFVADASAVVGLLEYFPHNALPPD